MRIRSSYKMKLTGDLQALEAPFKRSFGGEASHGVDSDLRVCYTYSR